MDSQRFRSKPSLKVTITGFSLLEIAVVVMIMGTVMAVVTLTMSANDDIKLQSAAEQLLQDIRYTQAMALTAGRYYFIQRQSSTTYRILNFNNVLVPTIYSTTGIRTLTSGVTMSTWGTYNVVAFSSRGEPFQGVSSSNPKGPPTMPFTSNMIITLTSPAGRTKLLTINQYTGFVS
jgi:type II secretory pathway pseudopilin PulG